jgi:hypothetical protein
MFWDRTPFNDQHNHAVNRGLIRKRARLLCPTCETVKLVVAVESSVIRLACGHERSSGL